MKLRVLLAAAAAASGLLWGCASGSGPAPAASASAPAEAGIEQPTERDEAIQAAIEHALNEPEALASLELFAECLGDAGTSSVRVFGNGVGIWDDREQFHLSTAEVRSLLSYVRESDFASWKPVYGGKGTARPADRPDRPDAIFATTVLCRVSLSLTGHTKESVQLLKGDRFPPLIQLAEEILKGCRGPAQSGVGAADLEDALFKVSSGELAPETLTLMLHRRPEATDAETAGFLLRVKGRTVSSSVYRPGEGQVEPRRLTLEAADLGQLAAELAAIDIETLPINLYASDYTDFSVRVLNHRKTIQARQFAGMGPESHGESQTRFDLLYETLDRLRLRVVAEGQPAS